MLSPEAMRYLGAAIAVMALYGVGMSMGNLFSTWLNAIARNPEASDKMRITGFLGMALTESIGLFAFVIAFLILVK